jgi:hypothetical protein
LTQQGFVCFAFQTVSLADVTPDAHLVDHMNWFRPFLSRSIGIQSICQSGIRTAEVVSAETAIFGLARPGNPIYIATASAHKVFQYMPGVSPERIEIFFSSDRINKDGHPAFSCSVSQTSRRGLSDKVLMLKTPRNI